MKLFNVCFFNVLFTVGVALPVSSCSSTESLPKKIQWNTVDIFSDSGALVSIEGDPEIASYDGSALYFDGQGDRLLIKGNPLLGAREFTVEMEIFPHESFPDNIAPRMLHLENIDNSNLRITLELRLTEDNKWYFDAFIKSNDGGVTLVDSSFLHEVGKWHHVAITYEEGRFSTWVNGRKELVGTASFQDLGNDTRVSVGARMNRIHWFDGSIRNIFFTKEALEPSEFTIVESDV